MGYPKIPSRDKVMSLLGNMGDYAALMHEYGAEGIQEIIDGAFADLEKAVGRIKTLPADEKLKKLEPDDLDEIKALRTEGPRRLVNNFNEKSYREKLEGSLLARMAGCTLGAIVEFWSIEDMKEWAKKIGDNFPPTDYWSSIKNPMAKRYSLSRCEEYTKNKMDGVPVDDDIAYTLLGLLIAEDHGINFTTEDVAKAWIKYLPYACTAEDVALRNIKSGIPANKAADVDNPFVQWIGADIRSDPFGYLAPGYPEKAAQMAYYDAYLSHRRNGIYGEMFFSAVISAAFVSDNATEAIKTGLTEIPRNCALYGDVIWALETSPTIKNYMDARSAVDEKFKGMSGVHTNLNACLTIFGLLIGGRDVTKVISETVAMGYDNDCTAATAGSIVGALVGKAGVPEYWYKNFNNKVYSYLNNIPMFKIDDLIDRFTKKAILNI